MRPLASSVCFPALRAVTPRASPAQRAGAAALFDHLAVIGRATDAVVARGIKPQGAAATLFDRAPGVATARGHAIAPGAVVAKGATAHLWKGLHRLLGKNKGHR